MKTRILAGLVFVLLVMQTFRPARNSSAIPPFAGKSDIALLFPTSSEVRKVLAESCYDCHSNQTTYPWYAEVQPVGWWLENHVESGRRKLNFAEFAAYPVRKQMKELKAVREKVRDRKMPLASYTLIHRNAKLTEAQLAALCRWSESAQDQLAKK